MYSQKWNISIMITLTEKLLTHNINLEHYSYITLLGKHLKAYVKAH
jgi:hypothetical protein